MSDKQRSCDSMSGKRYMLTAKGQLYSEWLGLKDAVRKVGGPSARKMMALLEDYFADYMQGDQAADFAEDMRSIIRLDKAKEPKT